MMKKESIKFNCFTCPNEYEMGFGVYEGKCLPLYADIFVCLTCYNGNFDGWSNPAVVEKLINHLKEKSLPVPERNEKGWLPRG
ncbi:hypothetical protein MNBD_DELTA01-33 [hydrothermal vent metagenome]|uniref:Uncharacterized protein n=1 Tax=hydrothermal vent metagenome TaxID=652676 RepID=A0A3B0RGN0_9ZZZZ